MTNDQFPGFPPGDLKFTSVPDFFFARLLPEIDNLVELKVTLHILWLRQRENKQAVSLAELHTDETLISSLSLVAEDPFAALQDGLQRAVARNSLLYARLEDENGQHDLYFLNSEGGRMALDKMQSGKLGIVAVSGADIASPTYAQRPNMFELYEANISLISPIIADELKDAEQTYPQEWIEEAFKIAVENNVRKWSYIRAVLEGMATEGPDGIAKRKTQKDTEKRWYTDDEFKHIIQH
jgi:DnaD/phage-associated family protein